MRDGEKKKGFNTIKRNERNCTIEGLMIKQVEWKKGEEKLSRRLDKWNGRWRGERRGFQEDKTSGM